MPWKNYQKKRYNIIDVKYYKDFIKKTGIDIDYDTFKSVIVDSNKIMANTIIAGNDGVRLPKNLGAITVHKYKPNKKAVDYKNTALLGKVIYHNNLNTLQHMFKIVWFRIDITKLYTSRIYKFDPSRNLKRSVSKFAQETNGSNYFEWKYQDFYEATRLERYMLNRENKKK